MAARVGLERRALARRLRAPVAPRAGRSGRTRCTGCPWCRRRRSRSTRTITVARGLRDVAGAVAVHAQRLVRVLLRAVDVGPGGAVDDDVARGRSRRARRRRSVTSRSARVRPIGRSRRRGAARPGRASRPRLSRAVLTGSARPRCRRRRSGRPWAAAARGRSARACRSGSPRCGTRGR